MVSALLELRLAVVFGVVRLVKVLTLFGIILEDMRIVVCVVGVRLLLTVDFCVAGGHVYF